MIDHSRVVERHHCEQPEILRVEFPDQVKVFTPTVTVLHPEGTWFSCDDCGLRWTVWRQPDQVGPHVFVAGGLRWRAETRWERWTRRWRR